MLGLNASIWWRRVGGGPNFGPFEITDPDYAGREINYYTFTHVTNEWVMDVSGFGTGRADYDNTACFSFQNTGTHWTVPVTSAYLHYEIVNSIGATNMDIYGVRGQNPLVRWSFTSRPTDFFGTASETSATYNTTDLSLGVKVEDVTDIVNEILPTTNYDGALMLFWIEAGSLTRIEIGKPSGGAWINPTLEINQ